MCHASTILSCWWDVELSLVSALKQSEKGICQYLLCKFWGCFAIEMGPVQHESQSTSGIPRLCVFLCKQHLVEEADQKMWGLGRETNWIREGG